MIYRAFRETRERLAVVARLTRGLDTVPGHLLCVAATFTSAHGNLMIHEVFANNVSAVNVGGAFPAIIERALSASATPRGRGA